MQLTVDVDVLNAPQSGVGVYASEILARLSKDFVVERRTTSSAPAARATKSQLRGLIRRVPFAYDLRRLALGWPPTRSLFWGPNFLLPPGPLLLGPTVVTVHDLLFAEHPEWADPIRGAFLRRELPKTLANSDAVIVTTLRTKQAVAERYGVDLFDRTHVIPLGVRDLLAMHGLARSKAPSTILCVGNIERRKDPLTLLHAHRQLAAAERRDRPLVFVGGALDEAYAEELTRALDPPYSRWVRDADGHALAVFLSEAALLVAPSLAEGFGLVPLEAAAAGVPVIAADLAVTRELLGNGASYFPPGDAAALAALLRSPPTSTRLPKAYSWEVAAARHAELFTALGRSPS